MIGDCDLCCILFLFFVFTFFLALAIFNVSKGGCVGNVFGLQIASSSSFPRLLFSGVSPHPLSIHSKNAEI